MEDTSTAIVKVTAISGARQDHAPACYLLEIDQAKILLDVGSDDAFSTEHLAVLAKLTKSLDLVLLSHGDLKHCGGLPKLLGMFELNGPVLATVPVHHLGLVTLYDVYQSYYQAEGVPPFNVSLDEIDAAFEKISMLRYSQSYTCTSGPAMGIQVTPIAAGHSLGGAIWRIRKHTEEIFYAMDFNHKKEAHLDGAALEVVQRPALLIADAQGALDVHVMRKQRDHDIVDAICSSLKAGGTVLLPADTAGRTLELLQIIEAHWNSSKLSYPVFFLAHQSQRAIDLAKGMLEWMSQSLAKVFEHDRSNPFDLASIRICHSLDQIKSIAGPKAIIASMASLDSGHSRCLIPEILGASSSCILFTTPSRIDSIAARVLTAARGVKIDLSFAEQIPLEGDELQKYRQNEREEGERRAAEEAFALLQQERDHGSESDDDSDQESNGGKTSESKAKRLEQEQINSAAALQNFYWTDYRQDWHVDVDSLPAKLIQNAANSPFYPMVPPDVVLTTGGGTIRHQVFPFKELTRPFDAYGEAVDLSNDFRPKSQTLRITSIIDAVVPAPTALIQTITPITDPLASSVPTKWNIIQKQVQVKATRKYISLTGHSDGRSLKTIYSRIQPRRLLLVGGSQEATDYLANHFAQTLAIQMTAGSKTLTEVFSPHLGETITVSSAVNVMQAILAESLISKLQLQMLGDYELAWVKGIVRCGKQGVQEAPQGGDDMEIDEEKPDRENQVVTASSRLITLTSADDQHEYLVPILIGDPRLSEIRRILQNEMKIEATFVEGDLVCGEGERRIRIKRDSQTSSLTIEGPFCAEYYSVRSAIYATTSLVQ